ncbi:Aste57867_7744 [Aphanomyces stellatus]|uniref:Aste57867_7744 protein n=1 Tax=Aphanomyces stellatus TaxID=120398 RepID=A0A485KIS4_9STRA|nr:hypothetical protein As57867_007715 [Aphanomyces stellatus]VFT84644.1 Aste57867_7744 [Aphanomyces stellatus]
MTLRTYVQEGNIELVRLTLPSAATNDVQGDGERCLLCETLHNFNNDKNESTNKVQEEIFHLLLACNLVDVNYICHELCSPLMTAVRVAPIEIIRQMCQHPATRINLKDKDGNGALMYAAKAGRAEIIWFLVNCEGIDTSSVNEQGQTPLMGYIEANAINPPNDFEECVQLLLQGTHVTDKECKTALLLLQESKASKECKEAITRLLCNSPDCEIHPTLATTNESTLPSTTATMGAETLPPRSDLATHIVFCSTAQSAVSENGITKVDTPQPPDYFGILHDGDAIQLRNLLIKATRQDLQQVDNDGMCLICRAIFLAEKLGDYGMPFEILLLMLDCVAVDINYICKDGKTPLMRAVGSSLETIVGQICRRRDIQINMADDTGQTALHMAAVSSNSEKLRSILQYDGINVNSINGLGQTPLMNFAASVTAAMRNRMISIDFLFLICPDIDVNVRNMDGKTAVMLLQDSSADDMVKEEITRVIAKRPTLDISTVHPKSGDTLWSWALARKFDSIVDILLQRKDFTLKSLNPLDPEALVAAARSAPIEILNALSEQNESNINYVNLHGDTALQVAATRYRHDVVERLLQCKRIDINKVDKVSLPFRAIPRQMFNRKKNGNSALMLLAKVATKLSDYTKFKANDPKKAAQFLLGAPNIDVNATNYKGESALFMLLESGIIRSPHMVDFIASWICRHKSFNVSKKLSKVVRTGRFLITPLAWALQRQMNETASALLDRTGVDLNSPDDDNNSPLVLATMQGNVIAVEKLCRRRDVDVNFLTTGCTTSLYLVCQSKSKMSTEEEQLRELLLSRDDLDINLRYEEGMTVLHIATRNHRSDIVQRLCQRLDLQPNLRDESDRSALFSAVRNGYDDILHTLLARRDVDSNICCEDDKKAVLRAVRHGFVTTLEILLTKTAVGSYLEEISPLAIEYDQYEVAQLFLTHGVAKEMLKDPSFSMDKLAPLLTPTSAETLLLYDLPIEIRNHAIVNRVDHAHTWAKFMDSHTPLPSSSIRLEVVASILNHPNFKDHRRVVARQLALATDQQGRTVLQITDADTRTILNEVLFFCGRYDIADGKPIHVSATAIVVHAYDHGLFKQVFRQHAKDDVQLAKADIEKCFTFLGQSHDTYLQFLDTTSAGDDIIHEADFVQFCTHQIGDVAKVALKFMRNQDEHAREVHARKSLDREFVIGLLPMLDQDEISHAVTSLTLPDGLNMIEYPYVLVMPAADRSLEDIFLKERPDDNKIRALVQDVATALSHLHAKRLVHGDLKKLNVLRVNHKLQLADMDATTAFGKLLGSKFSSGILPPEMFYKLQDDADESMHEVYWKRTGRSEMRQKVKPRGGGYVVRSFHESIPPNGLPYILQKASPAHDIWAFGCMLYQMYSESELVPTDRNQDVEDEAIARAATWTNDELRERIRHKIPNALARDLIESLLVVDPDCRMNIKQVLAHPYFHVESTSSNALILSKLDKLDYKITSGFQDISTKLTDVTTLTREGLNDLAKTKEELMRGIFQATEVLVPTSFVILPFNLRDKTIDVENALEETSGFLHKITKMGERFMDATKANKAIGPIIRIVTPGAPLFLYLIDEVNGSPVVPDKPDALYPIEIDTKSQDYVAFMTTALPYLQKGFKFLKAANTIAGFLKALGVPSLEKEALDNMSEKLEQATKMSLVFDFDVLQSAVESTSKGAPVERIRGAALRQLVRFFEKADPEKDFSGLERTYASNGHAVWTAKACVQVFEAQRLANTAQIISKNSIQDMTPPEMYLAMLNEMPQDEARLNKTPHVSEHQVIVKDTRKSPCSVM